MGTERKNILVAETAPMIAAGMSYWLRRLPGLQTHVTVVDNEGDMESYLRTNIPDLIMVNPTFGGIFKPEKFRIDHEGEVKLVAILSMQYSPVMLREYDGTVSIFDDLAGLTRSVKDVLSVSEIGENSRESLSQREREIVALVVKGMTNKEIADKLFLSPHTVMTHRRNIARKLEIHSATGLTIFAIVNHIVELSDLNL